MCKHDNPEIDELFRGFSDIQPDAGTSSQAVERTRRALLEHAEPCVRVNQSWWRSTMKRRSYVAVGAVLALVVALIALPTFSRQSASTAFAQLREQLDKVRTITFDLKLEVEGEPAETLRQIVRDDGRSRAEYPDGRYSVAKRREETLTRMDVDPAKKTVRIGYGFLEDEPQDVISLIRSMPESAGARAVDARKIDGRSCPGFVVNLKVGKEGSQQMRLWIDPETRLPVYSEVVAERKLPRGGRPEGAKASTRAVATLTNFRYNVPLEDSLFALTPPEGYSVTSVGSPPERRSDQWPGEKLVLTVGQGIGLARFGMSKERVLELLGEPEERREPKQHLLEGLPVWETEIWMYNSQGFSLTFSNLPDPGLYSVTCRRGSFGSRGFRGKTKEGIGLGSTPEEVRRAYGDPQQEQPIKDGLGAFRYHDKRMMVGFVDGKVSLLQIARIPKEKQASHEHREE